MGLKENTNKKIVILGAGITGLTVALELSKKFKGNVVILEKDARVGGLAGTLNNKNGFLTDIGSHRIHLTYEKEALEIIKELCGDELLKRERNGLIFIGNRFVKYPPSIFDIVTSFGIRDSFKFIVDLLKARFEKLFSFENNYSDFESFTVSEIGKSLYENFYKPYALKLWDLPPSQISKEPAESRIRKFTITSIMSELKNRFMKNGKKYYYYPKKGIGQIANLLKEEFIKNGGEIVFIQDIEKLSINNNKVEKVVYRDKNGELKRMEQDIVISTIPMEALYGFVMKEPNNGKHPFNLKYRCIRILYLVTKDKVPCKNETFYFPETNTIIGRVSEVGKYSPYINSDHGKSVLTIEMPCTYKDEIWEMDDSSLAKLCVDELKRFNILRQEMTEEPEYFSKKVKDLYPVYELGWKEKYNKIYNTIDSIENLYMIGRSALFLHCNIDHCMVMGLKLAKHLSNGALNKEEWNNVREGFFNFKVRE